MSKKHMSDLFCRLKAQIEYREAGLGPGWEVIHAEEGQ
jgi:hypothetical protein